MKIKIVTIAVMVVVAALLIVPLAQAASSTTMAIINDARDGHIDGNYTAAQVQAALAALKSDPSQQQYTDVEGVLEDFLASLSSPGVSGSNGGLMFTGSETIVLFGVGLALMGTGLALRKRRA